MKRANNRAATPAGDMGPSIRRTIVPMIAGGIVSLIVTSGLELDPDDQSALLVGLTAVLGAGYYSLVRAFESHLPAWLVRLLLGSSKTPVYRDGGAS